jgi:hypothetical protein
MPLVHSKKKSISDAFSLIFEMYPVGEFCSYVVNDRVLWDDVSSDNNASEIDPFLF